jgi:signal transduction histidine kinase/ActR/RegA family two-component response regulator
MISRRILSYVLAVDLLALIAFGAVLPLHSTVSWTGLFLLSTLVALAGSTPVRIPGLKSAVSATDPFVLTALAAHGPTSACVVAAMGVIGGALGRDRERKPLHLAFNLGNVVLSAAAASQVYILLGGRPGHSIQTQVWPLLGAATIYFLFNTGLVASAIFVETQRHFFKAWKEQGLWMVVSTYVGLTLSACLLLVLELVGPSGLALGIPPVWLLVAFYRTHKQRQEEQQRRIDQVEVLNTRLEEKVGERTQELQDALSHLKDANTKLRMANDRLIEANRAKSEFLANVSHELRTPLNAIIGFSDLLRVSGIGELNQQQADFLSDIHESGEHLLRLINDILDLSKIEAGKMEVHLQPLPLPKAIGEAVAMLHPQASQKHLRLEVDCSRGVTVGELDPGMFRQVLVNLLSNAVKFTPDGGRVEVIARREGADLVVQVADTGIGMRPEDTQKIFDEFFQVDGSYARNYGGTGLGLALVRRMVRMQGGEISVASTPDAGSRFTCRFWDCMRDEAPRVSPARPPREAPVAGGDGRTLLVVEDNPINRKLARNVLRSRGYRVLEAATGEDGLSMLERESVDLVLMDIQLPGMDGLEITRRLKADPRTAGIPVVALTAHAQENDEARAREAGCEGYITKPIRLAQFPAQVEAYLPERECVA